MKYFEDEELKYFGIFTEYKNLELKLNKLLYYFVWI